MKPIHRLEAYIKYKKLNSSAFDKSINASNGYIGKQIKNNASIGSDVIEKIASVYSDLNINWLITGEGEMLLSYDNFSNNQIAYGENSNIVQGKGNVIHGAIQGNKVHKVTKDAEASPEIRNMLSELELENKYLKQKVKDLEILIAQKEMLIEEKERMIQLLMGARGK